MAHINFFAFVRGFNVFKHIKHLCSVRKRKLKLDISKTTENETLSNSCEPNSSEPHIHETKNNGPPPQSKVYQSFANIKYPPKRLRIERKDWYVVGCSSIGRNHITTNKPCQDNHFCSIQNDGWGMAIISDGAGSAENSHLGSKHISERAFDIFKQFLIQNNFIEEKIFLQEKEWQEFSIQAFRQLYKSLFDFCFAREIEFHSVACTVSIVIFSPNGLLSTHIGDGRAGYCTVNGEWKPLFIPHKGEEANHTIFLTSSPWSTSKEIVMSNVLVAESRVVNEKISAFTLMTDGCENHAFECSKFNRDINKWFDPNVPSEKFFNPLCQQLKSLKENNVSEDEANLNWRHFIESGNQGLKEESDDKTLILGILI